MSRYFETTAKKIVNSGWSHGKYLDYWSFVHGLTGIIIGMVSLIITPHHFIAFIVIIIKLCVYEVLEVVARVAEDFQNALSDIVIGTIGSAIAIFVLPYFVSELSIFLLLGMCITVNLLAISRGWKNYLKRKSLRSGSYKYNLYTLYCIYTFGTATAIVSFLHWLGYF